MHRLLVISLFACVNLAASVAGAEEAHTNPPQPSNDDPQLKAELDDISDIRQRLGIDLFKGTSLEQAGHEPNGPDQFLQAYQRLAEKNGPALNPISRQNLGPGSDLHGINKEFELVDALHQARRQLELSASSRADAGNYDEARRLLKLAKRIRRLLPDIEAGITVHEATRTRN